MKRLFIAVALVFMASCGRKTAYYTPEQMDERIACWYDYSTINRAMLDSTYNRPYNGDWPESYEIGADSSHLNGTFTENDVAFWDMLQNARSRFHADNLWLRAHSNKRVCRALDRTEAAFDSVFVTYLRSPYYMRAQFDAYQEVMPSTIDLLINNL